MTHKIKIEIKCKPIKYFWLKQNQRKKAMYKSYVQKLYTNIYEEVTKVPIPSNRQRNELGNLVGIFQDMEGSTMPPITCLN